MTKGKPDLESVFSVLITAPDIFVLDADTGAVSPITTPPLFTTNLTFLNPYRQLKI